MTAPERIMYLARRHPSFPTRAAWVPRWRAHWELAASQPESATVRRYIQGEVLDDDDVPPHDVVASAEYRSTEERLRNRAAAGYHATMRADEALVFDRLIRDCSFIGTHHVLAGSGLGPFKVVRFVRRADAVPAGEFAAAWERWASWLAARPGEVLGCAQTRALPPPAAAGRWGLDVDGAEEIWFSDAEAARTFLRGDELAVRTAAAPFTVTDAVVAAEVVLKDDRS